MKRDELVTKIGNYIDNWGYLLDGNINPEIQAAWKYTKETLEAIQRWVEELEDVK